MKKIVNGKQWTILFHVDDLNMLHVDSGIFLAFLLTLTQNTEKNAKLAITWGKIHKYHGMTIY